MNAFKFCTNCGTKLSGDQKFCQTCGANVQNIAPISAPEFTSIPEPTPQYAPPQQAPAPQYAASQQAPAPQYAAPQQAPAPQYAAPQQAPAPQYAAPQQNQANEYAAPNQAQYQTNQYSSGSTGYQQTYTHQYSSSQHTQGTQEPQKPKRSNPATRDRILRIVGNSFMLVLALVMLLSAFLPLMSLKMEIPGIEKSVTVNFNAIDSIQMLFASFGSLDDEEVQDKMEELQEDDDFQEYAEDWEEGKKLNKIGPYIKKIINITLSHEDAMTTVAVATMGILSIAQIVLTAIFIFVAVTHFMSSLRGLAKPISSTPFILFGISALMMFLNTFSIKYLFDQLNGNFYFAEMKSSVADWVLTSQIILLVGLVALLIIKIIEKPYHIGKKEIIKRSLSIAFAVVLLISLSAPIITTEIKSQFTDTERKTTIETKLDSAIFNSFATTDSIKEDYAELSSENFEAGAQSTFDYFSYLEKRDLKKPTAEGKSANTSLLSYLLLGAGAYKYSLLFELGSLLVVIIAACALLIIMQHVYELITRRKSAYAVMTLSKTFAIIMALAILALVIVIMSIVNHNADTATIDYSTKLAYGPILMVAAAIALACVPPVYGFEFEKKQQ